MRIAQWLFGGEVEHTGLILGNDASGKTTMLYQLKMGQAVQTIPTIGFNVETVEYPKGRKATLWDIGGCDQMRNLVKFYIHKDRFLMFLHDCTDDRWDFSIEYLHMVLQSMAEVGARHVWILLTKQDLLPLAEREAIVSDLKRRFEAEVAEYRDTHIIKIIDNPGLSATTAEQLDIVMTEIVGTLQNEKKHKTTFLTPQPENPELSKGPAEQELVERINETTALSQRPKEFWEAFLEADLPSWDHYTHLRAGFFVLYDCFAKGRNIFQCADEFMAHLGRLREKNPDRFRNTAHRTMTIFWLVQLQIAATAYQADNNLGLDFPSYDAFSNILLYKPQLMNSGLWREYYSKDLLFSPAARESWHLPDIKPFPVITRPAPTPLPTTSDPDSDPDRLIRFAFAVIQKTLTSEVRRGAIVKQALDALQTSTIRARAAGSSIPPYSETQAYFWIQFTHAAIQSLDLNPQPKATASPTAMAFPAFKALFNLTGTEWQAFYKPETWNTISSRTTFVNPDIKPLPNVLAVPSTADLQLARTRMASAVNYRLTAPLQLPPREEIGFIAAVLLDEARLLPEDELNVESHASMLRFVHQRLVTRPQGKKLSTLATGVTLDLARRIGLTQSSFWVQQVLIALAKGDAGQESFDSFVLGNPHLAYEDLPLMYYTSEMWFSSEAKDIFIPPDRHQSPSIVSRSI